MMDTMFMSKFVVLMNSFVTTNNTQLKTWKLDTDTNLPVFVNIE